MPKYFIAVFLMLTAPLFGAPAAVSAAWQAGELSIIELKMTGSETIVIANTSQSTLNLQNYIIQYFNKNVPVSLSAPTSAQQLPDMSLASGQAILLNSDSAATCGAAAVAEMEFTMSDTSGYLAIMKVESQSDDSFIYRPQDRASWTSAATGADLNKVPSATADPKAVWYRSLADGSWQQAQLGPDCGLLNTLIVPADTPTYVQWATGEEPPATIVSTATTSESSSSTASIPRADIGLAAPQITELLPNVASPQTDSEDEFIELYNPNNATFDLSGFVLEVGLSTKHKYKLPDGTTIAPKSFKSFFSADTSLALTNTGSQAFLIDPPGTVIAQTEAYPSAKDGQAWALANGKWYWTTNPTPNAANVIKAPATKASGSAKIKSTSSKSSSGTVKGASTQKSTPATAIQTSDVAAKSSLHPLVLGGVGALALAYAGYEYRRDFANQLHRAKRWYASRSTR